MSTTADDTTAPGFAATLRERTMTDHRDAEGSTLMGDLMAGTLEHARIGDMLAQHLLVYRALEGTAESFRDDPVVAPFLDDDLARTPALEHDVALLLGPDAVADPTPHPATATYVARIEATAGWGGGFVAHHYTRYLGDLSGGQHIGRVVARAYPDLPIRFYTFDRIASPKAVKEAYRARLDAAPWSDEERDRIVDEVRAAYALNTELFAQLDRAPA
jgi:heme oxygenase